MTMYAESATFHLNQRLFDDNVFINQLHAPLAVAHEVKNTAKAISFVNLSVLQAFGRTLRTVRWKNTAAEKKNINKIN